MAEDKERELLQRVCAIPDFFGCVIMDDRLPDWRLAEEYGNFLIRLSPEDPTAHMLIARACRHLGELDRALAELRRCRELIAGGKVSVVEQEALSPILDAEERYLSTNRP